MIYGSVCSGVEAASVAWKPLGWAPAWFSEIDEFPSEVLKYRFPDNWTQIPWKGKSKKQCPDSHRYKAMGNSMTVYVMRWIGERIKMFETITKEGSPRDDTI